MATLVSSKHVTEGTGRRWSSPAATRAPRNSAPFRSRHGCQHVQRQLHRPHGHLFGVLLLKLVTSYTTAAACRLFLDDTSRLFQLLCDRNVACCELLSSFFWKKLLTLADNLWGRVSDHELWFHELTFWSKLFVFLINHIRWGRSFPLSQIISLAAKEALKNR